MGGDSSKATVARRLQTCASAWNNPCQAMEQPVPSIGTTCAKHWNKVCQALEQSVPSIGTKCAKH